LADLKKKILWQCRRGLWELDAILVPFVEANFDDLNVINQDLFRELVSFEDVEVFDLLVNKKEPKDARMKPLVDIILSCHEKTLGGD
jgi:antitoxin CptB